MPHVEESCVTHSHTAHSTPTKTSPLEVASVVEGTGGMGRGSGAGGGEGEMEKIIAL